MASASEQLRVSTYPPKEKSREVTPESAFQTLLQAVKEYMPHQDLSVLDRAYEYASRCHKNQMRRSGEPYITHPLEVATILTSMRVDLHSVIAAVLHDTVEDTCATLDEIRDLFGAQVADLVDGLTKISKIKFQSNQEKLAENFRKMIMAMAKDIRVILIKLGDRLHNMRTIGAMPPDKGVRIAQETLDIYAPLANRLGIYGIKSELEDLCLRTLKYDIYKEISDKVSKKRTERQRYIDDVIAILKKELEKYGFKDALVFGRPKHFYSIYKKMVDRRMEFEDVHDLFAFRIIVPGLKDCYEALGIVHAMWKPMPGRFKDYIAMPKANMYQSLHTTVIRPNGEPAEIQIRTREMHDICELGIAAHWAYKERNDAGMGQEDLKKFSWLRQIVQWQSELQDPNEFLEAVKVDLFDEEIFVFTPKGDVISLPLNATALDFAFGVHTDIGLKTIGVKVNGRMVPIKRTLQSGDIVEILTSPNQRPRKDWLNFVTTSKARNKIRSALRSEQRDRSYGIGEEVLGQELERLGLDLQSVRSGSDADQFVKAAREAKFDDVLIAIGYGKYEANDLVAKVYPNRKPLVPGKEPVAKPAKDNPPPTGDAAKSRAQKHGVLVSGLDRVLVNFGKCCNPLPGEEIIGFITRGRGVTVHRTSCPRALDTDPHRRIDVSWTSEETPSYHTAYVRIITKDRTGVLAEVTDVISKCGANIQKAEIRVDQEMHGILDFELGLHGLKQLQAVINKLERISNVISVERRSVFKTKS